MIKLQVLAVLVAAFSAAVSVYFSIRTRREAEAQRKESKAQRFVQIAQIEQEYRSQLWNWATRVVQTMGEARMIVEDSAHTSEINIAESRRIRMRLSALIDEGRWFFSNEDKQVYGTHKLPAFQGFRPTVLDALVEVFRELKDVEHRGTDHPDNTAHGITDNIKIFVNEIGQVVGPEPMQQEIDRLKSGFDNECDHPTTQST